MIATQLEKIKEDYESAGDSAETMEKLLLRKKRSLPTIEDNVKKLEKEYRDLEGLRSLESKIDYLEKLLCWILLKEKQKEISNLDDTKKKIELEIEKNNSKLQKIIVYFYFLFIYLFNYLFLFIFTFCLFLILYFYFILFYFILILNFKKIIIKQKTK